MIRCSFLREIGGYDESLRCQDGFDLWIRFTKRFDVRNVNLALFFYRQHAGSMTRNEDRILSTRLDIIRRNAEQKGPALNILAVIAVRGPSADPSSQALRMLGDKPLLDWSLHAACEARRISKVVLSTPDPQVISHARNFLNSRLHVIERSQNLAYANTPLEATMRHSLDFAEESGEKYDAILQLAIESPFRLSHHIDSAVDVMELFDTDVVVGVREETDIFYRHNGHGLKPISEPSCLRLEREDIYREVGSMRLFRREQLTSEVSQKAARIGHLVLDQRASMRIVSPFDWSVAEYVSKSLIDIIPE